MRIRIRNLIEGEAALWLVQSFDIIVLLKFKRSIIIPLVKKKKKRLTIKSCDIYRGFLYGINK